VLVVSSRPDNRDPLHLRTRQIQAEPGQLAVAGPAPADPSYAARWRAADRSARRLLDDALAAPEAESFEGAYVRILADALPAGTPCFVAASMPVRDVEFFWPATRSGLRVFVNRGANGIDGTLSTALGVAHRRAPAVLLTGDLALLHDTNGLLVAKELAGSLTIVLINNSGGGIFEHLPVAYYDPPFERYFATPQTVDFSRLAEAHGCGYRRVTTPRELARELAHLPATGVRILEVVTDRKRDAAFRKALFARVARDVGAVAD
jgi:2-succinyl-5-enolpyruvyl-6-hydroxy-3-cyclohexene-1-carboxylate synthase